MTGALAVRPRLSLTARLRVGARILAMVVWLGLCIPLHFLAAPFTRHNPAPRLFLGGIAAIAGVRLRIEGAPAARGAFLLANHVSWIDIPALARASGAAFVAHDGLAGVPVLRWLCSLNDTVFVARHARASVRRQVDQVREALRDTGALAIFPEGTTSDGTGLLPFKSSLLSALEPRPEGIAVHPVLLDYGPESAAIAWVGDEHGVDNFLRILARRRPVALGVRFLPPLAGDALDGRKAMAAAARAAMLAELEGGQRVAL